MNSLNAMGRLSRDAEVRYMSNGDPVMCFSFALTSGYGDKQVTTWLNCSMFGKRSETLAPLLVKGIQIGITGEIFLRKYNDKAGSEKSSLECRVSNVTLPDKKNDSADKSAQNKVTSSSGSGFDDFEDDIPF